jgi:hypothetical protein
MVLNRYCVTCRSEQMHTAGLMLDKMDLANVSERGAMPPAGMQCPDAVTYGSLRQEDSFQWPVALIAGL